ncbi:porin [Aquabacterium sp. J223]|uniref:porin n=1 Tax=Aquabacterium sp. J223 TaxID=2898431 RepID=UPI0021AE0163|nr:porin [Aquabacterium sp. J223]UUX95013.1 porin [Aquabacterium sp. J223]
MKTLANPIARSALSASLALFAIGAQAQASSVTVFGVADASVRQTRVQGDSAVNSLASGGVAGSRLGVRGVEDLGGGLSAQFWLESDIALDTGAANATSFWSRRATLALASRDWGELRVGRDYVPLFVRQYVPFSPFGPNGVASNGSLFFGTPSLLGSGSGAGVRADNMVKYILPAQRLGGFYGDLMVSAGEGRNVNKHRGALVGYASGPVNVNVGFGDTDDTAGTDRIRLRSVGGAYDFGVVRLTALLQDGRYKQRRQRTLDVGAAVPVGAGTVKASIIRADQSGGGTDANDATQLSVGYTHALSKRSLLYGTFSRIDNRGTQVFGLGGVTPAAGRDIRGVEVGISHLF